MNIPAAVAAPGIVPRVADGGPDRFLGPGHPREAGGKLQLALLREPAFLVRGQQGGDVALDGPPREVGGADVRLPPSGPARVAGLAQSVL
ncbi:hypothetical protein [Streptomyces sp. NPDC059072]|uniref:hypothetical protein n=1 Tax=Streptomyces sp. NPDC059072 TaxID=3346715 RepID=UPI0036BF9086